MVPISYLLSALSRSLHTDLNLVTNSHVKETHLAPAPKPTSSASTPTALSLQSKTANPTFHFLAGALSGLSTSILLQPADLLKTRIQQRGSQHATLSQTLRSILSSPHPLRNLYRGTLPSALRTTLGSALYFTTLSSLRRHLLPLQSQNGAVTPTATQNLFTGAIARTLAGLLLMPITVLKVRYESSLYSYPSLSAASRSILATHGPRGFFAGFGATAVRDAPYAGLYVVFYEEGKRKLNSFVGATSQGGNAAAAVAGGGSSAYINFTAGIFSAILATTLTNPFDAVKTRVQLLPQRYPNSLRAAVLMLREEGPRSLMDGLGLRMARKAISSALAWTVYEECVRRAEGRWG
ncbi:MAG: hypothetical protein Q9160_000963 [Pyrenula sp. 1 TL-2023]